MIAEALASARCVVVVWSRDSVASSWVREEADEGRKRGVLIPVLIDEVNPPLGFGRIQAARMIEWDGAQESEAFQKLVEDITAVIDAPSARDAALETAAPKAPEHVAGAAQAVIARPEVSAAPRTLVHGRTMKLLLAGALVVALLAIAIYQMVPRGGDPSSLPRLSPAEATGLRLSAVLADGGEPLARGVTYEVYTAARDAEGNRKRVTQSNQSVRPPTVPAPGGTLLRNGRVRERVRKRGGRGHAGRGYPADLEPSRGHPPTDRCPGRRWRTARGGVAYEVYAAARDAEGNRKRVTGSNQRYEAPHGSYSRPGATS